MNIKLLGLYAVVNLFFSKGKPKPTLDGLGIISSVVSLGLPEPNCNWTVDEFNTLVTNL